MKKVLFISYNNPEKQNRGDDVYTWNILNSLKQTGCFLHIVTFLEVKKEKMIDFPKICKLADRLTYVDFFYKNILNIGLSIYPAMISNRKSKKMIRIIREILDKEKYDAVVVNMFRMSYLIDYIKNENIIYISHNNETLTALSIAKASSNLLKKAVYYLDYWKTKYYENKYLKKVDCITTISDYDAFCFKKIYPNANIKVLPPAIQIPKVPYIKKTIIIPKQVILCGSFVWVAKIQNLFSLLNAKNFKRLNENDITLLVVGRADEQLVSLINKKYKGVHMTGTVTSVDSFYDKAQLAIIPEYIGGGFKLKISEAIQHSLPIIAIKGAVTDFEMKPNEHYIEVNSFEDMIDAIINIYDNLDIQKELIKRSRELFIRRYTLSYSINVFKEII